MLTAQRVGGEAGHRPRLIYFTREPSLCELLNDKLADGKAAEFHLCKVIRRWQIGLFWMAGHGVCFAEFELSTRKSPMKNQSGYRDGRVDSGCSNRWFRAVGLTWAIPIVVLLLLASQAALAQQPAAPAAGAANGKVRGTATPTLDNVFATLDKDRDGRISKDEATGMYAQRFSSWDANGDGFASRPEIRDFRARMGLDDDGRSVAAGNANNAPANNRNTPAAARRNAAAPIATLLKEPTDWRLETFSVPPPFAPDIKLTGSEEARFALGMYDTTSSEYFTYVMAFALDQQPQLSAPELKDFLEKYFRGLSVGVGRRKGLTIDPAQIQAEMAAASSTGIADTRFVGQLVFIDSFTDGRKITLHVEADVIPRAEPRKTYMILLISPSSKDSSAWQKLHEIGQQTARSLP